MNDEAFLGGGGGVTSEPRGNILEKVMYILLRTLQDLHECRSDGFHSDCSEWCTRRI